MLAAGTSDYICRAIVLRKRWDEHVIPLPFSRTVIHFGTPIDTNPEDGPAPTVEELQERIEAALVEGARTANQLCRNRAAVKEAAG